MAPKQSAKKGAKKDAKEVAKTKEAVVAEVPKAQAPKVAAAKGEGAKVEAASKKRKAEEASKTDEKSVEVEEPPAKEAKVEETAEKEEDDKPDTRPRLATEVSFDALDSTLNVVPTMGSKVLASLTEGGMAFLVAGARATVGAKAGRYFFEAKLLDVSASGWNGPKGGMRPTLRVGVSLAEAPLVLGVGGGQAFFDSDGGFHVNGKKEGTSRRFSREHTVAVLLNLDSKSPNHNTISLFVDGVRASQPYALADEFKGKALFPHICFRGTKVLVNFGPSPWKALPFVCRGLQAAAERDTATSSLKGAKDGKYEVVLPVGIPEEGTFEWLDRWLAANPKYTELSDRKIVEWAEQSGHWPQRGFRNSMDKPDAKFNVPGLDDHSIQRVLKCISAIVPRNYVVMEVKSNLIEEERQEILKRFALPLYKKVARVVMGEPDEEFKELQQKKMLEAKQAKSDMEWKRKKVEKQKEKDRVARTKLIEERRKKAEEERKKRQAELEAKKSEKADKDKSKPDGKEGERKGDEEEEKEKADDKQEGGDADSMAVDEDKSTEQKKKDDANGDDEAKADVPEAEEEDEETEPPKVELSDEEKSKWFAPRTCPDLNFASLSRCIVSPSIPQKGEGFDEVAYEWGDADTCKKYLKEWQLEKKKSTRIEHITPGQWFKETLKAFNEKFGEWQAKQKQYKASDAGKAEAAARKLAEEKGEVFSTSEGDISALEDVADVGEGVPLFKDFADADWALLHLRAEFSLLRAAFTKDADDDERPGIPEAHVLFYYNRYFGKGMNFKGYGVENFTALAKLVKDTITIEGELLGSPLECAADDFASLLKHTEIARRERQRRLDAGDETARLNIAADAHKVSGHKPGGGKGAGGRGGGLASKGVHGKGGFGKGWKK